MSDDKERVEEPRKEPADDYYAGYYWGNDPYSSAQMPGRKSDEELKNDVLANLEPELSQVNVSVTNAVAVLTGVVKDYEQKRKAGAEAWRTSGITRVLNNLTVSDPETAGPSRK